MAHGNDGNQNAKKIDPRSHRIFFDLTTEEYNNLQEECNTFDFENINIFARAKVTNQIIISQFDVARRKREKRDKELNNRY